MKLHWSPRSPFVRKVMVVAHETGIAGSLELTDLGTSMQKPAAAMLADNPLGKIPTLVRDDGSALYDSAVICEYFASLKPELGLFPAAGEARWTALRRLALGDGLLDMMVLWRNLSLEPKERQPADILAGFRLKLDRTLSRMQEESAELDATPFRIDHIAFASALEYLDFRFAGENWRASHPALAAWETPVAARPSFQATRPKA